MVTANNALYVRDWVEVDYQDVGFGVNDRAQARASGCKWFPYIKGGEFRRWFGNRREIVDWEDDGRRLQTRRHPKEARIWATNFNLDYIFQPSVHWSDVTISRFSARHSEGATLFDSTGLSCFPDSQWRPTVLAFLNSKVVDVFLGLLNPTVHCTPGNVADLPFPLDSFSEVSEELSRRLIRISTNDWDAYERSWDFQSLPLLTASSDPTPTLESSYTAWITQNRDTIAEMKRLEEENNRLFIDAYGLADELTPDVPIEQITLTVNPAYRYGGKLTEEEQWTRFRQDTMAGAGLLRHRLHDGPLQPGRAGPHLCPQRQCGLRPRPLHHLPGRRGRHHPAHRHRVVRRRCRQPPHRVHLGGLGAGHLEENLNFLADNLWPKKNESSRETSAATSATSFFKDHLQTYKKRPIYWLFSSGKQKAFQCLVYLHRYNEGTLARMRTEYVIPLQGQDRRPHRAARRRHPGRLVHRPPQASSKRSATSLSSNTPSCRSSTRSSATTPTSASPSTSTTA